MISGKCLAVTISLVVVVPAGLLFYPRIGLQEISADSLASNDSLPSLGSFHSVPSSRLQNSICEKELNACTNGLIESQPLLSLSLDALKRDQMEWRILPEKTEASRERLKRELMFKDVLLILVRTRDHHIRILENYRHFFWDVIYLAPYIEKGNLSVLLNSGAAFETCEQHTFTDGSNWDYKSPACVASVVAHLMGWKEIHPTPRWNSILKGNASKRLKGVLVIHGDFWITPDFGQGMDFSKVWALHWNLVAQKDYIHAGFSGEYSPAKNDDDWFGIHCRPKVQTNLHAGYWRSGFTNGPLVRIKRGPRTGLWTRVRYRMAAMAPLRDKSIADIKNLTGFEKLSLDDQYCFGWVDAYYLPTVALASWCDLMQTIYQNHVINEIAVPIGFQALAFGGCAGSPRGQLGCSFQVLNCWGNCCKNANHAHIMNHSCGHKVNLQNVSLTDTMRLPWQHHKTRAETQLVHCYSKFKMCYWNDTR